jgi:hypothetical protein
LKGDPAVPEGQSQQPQQQASHGGEGKPVLVDVYAKLDSAGAVCCRHEWRFEDGSCQGNGTIEIPARKHSDPETPIHFHLHDDSGRQLRFDDRDPIWVSRDGCPTTSCEDPEIPRSEIEAQNKLLKVLNRNSEECELHYNLRFRDRSGKAAEYDPAIKNGGTT